MAQQPAEGARYALAFDTANEVIAIGVGALDAASRTIELVAQRRVRAHRASNTQLLPQVDELLRASGVARSEIACVVCGRGPGSFTGVRIAMATAKGAAQALGVALIGVSTLDAVAWGAWSAQVRGNLLVAADAMRKEVYPVRYLLDEAGAHRLEADRVIKATEVAQSCQLAKAGERFVAGDALVKYRDIVEPLGSVLPDELWEATGSGLLLAAQAAWRAGDADPFDEDRHNPAFALPVYTRLSDAEENERIRLSKNDPKNLRTGVQDVAVRRDQRATMHDTAILNARPDAHGITYKPLDAAHAADVAQLEARVMGSDAWNEHLVADELPRGDRSWWAAFGVPAACQPPEPADAADASGTRSRGDAEDSRTEVRFASAIPTISGTGGALADVTNEMGVNEPASLTCAQLGSESVSAGAEAALADVTNEMGINEPDSLTCAQLGSETSSVSAASGAGSALGSDGLVLIGYAGGWIVDGDVQILKVGVDPAWRRRGIARELLARVAADARDLGAETCSLEVRASNAGAQAFYKELGLLSVGTRPRYYSDGEDALIMQGQLPLLHHDVAGMELQVFDPAAEAATASGAGGIAEVEPAAGARAAAGADRGDVASSAHPRPLILAIESSCDETAAAIVDGAGNLVSDVVASQIDFHSRFGGVVPEIASRKHIEAICGVCDECFDVAAAKLGVPSMTWSDLDGVGVTYAPGLLGALVVGVAFAKGAAWAADLPLVGVNHLEGHLYANRIGAPDLQPPMVASLVSGGNTLLVHVKDWGDYETLGSTIDDAVGEAFDKVAKALGLGYPGGPVISREAEQGDPNAIAFPRAMMHSGDLRFSLSGLKTAVVTYINNERAAGRPLNIPDIAASFQQAVVDVQVAKAKKALQMTCAPTFCLGGGVAANPVLRAEYQSMCGKLGVRLIMPPLSACGDNAGMIALVALDRFRQGKFLALDADAQAHADLDKPY